MELKGNCSVPRLSAAGEISKCDSFFPSRHEAGEKSKKRRKQLLHFSSNQPCVLAYKARQEGNMRIRQAAR